MNHQFSLLYPYGYTPPNDFTSFDFLKDLYVDELFMPLSEGTLPWEKRQDDLSQYFTAEPEVIKYRLDIIEDLLNHPELCTALEEALPQFRDIKQLRQNRNLATNTTNHLYSISEIEMYIDCIEGLHEGFQKSPGLRSEGLKRFCGFIEEVYTGEEYKNLKSETAKMTKSIRNIKSVTIGVNLDAQLHPIEAGVVAVNEESFRSGNVMDRLLRLDIKDDGFRCITPLLPYGKNTADRNAVAFTMAMNNAIDTIFSSAVRSWQPVVRQYVSHRTDLLISLTEDIRFLLGAVNMIKRIQKLGLPMCKPEICKMEERTFTVQGLYNPYIAMRMSETSNARMVLNDFQFDDQGMIYILTGPNQGGKSVFTYAVGIAQVLFQLGLFVPAKSAKISPVDRIFTNFPAKEEAALNKGRLGEECARIAKMLDEVTRYSLVLMDETFSSTSAIEATYIAKEVITGLSLIGARCLFATHLHDLTQMTDEMNAVGGVRIDHLSAEMKDEKTGERSYRILRTRPDGLSYARNIAEKYGITLEHIKKRIAQ